MIFRHMVYRLHGLADVLYCFMLSCTHHVEDRVPQCTVNSPFAHLHASTFECCCRIPLPRGNSSSNSEPAYVDWLYLDDDLRVTRGSKGSMFIHTKS